MKKSSGATSLRGILPTRVPDQLAAKFQPPAQQPSITTASHRGIPSTTAVAAMPPSLFKPSAFRALAASSPSTPSTTRLFTSTTVLSHPPPRHTTTTTTTTHRLGSIMKDRNAAPSATPSSSSDAAERMLARHRARIAEQRQSQLESAERVKDKKIAKDLLKQMPRKWQAGDVYAPHDLSAAEMEKWRKRSARVGDLVDALNLSPLDLYKVRLPHHPNHVLEGKVVPY